MTTRAELQAMTTAELIKRAQAVWRALDRRILAGHWNLSTDEAERYLVEVLGRASAKEQTTLTPDQDIARQAAYSADGETL